jgi:acetylornithine/succinyldiaminopimelate/putrescine aminotransferase
VLEIIERDHLLDHVTAMGADLVRSITEARLPYVAEVRSIGLMVGVQLAPDFPKLPRPPALEIVHRCIDQGLLVIPAGDSVVRLLPPLNVCQLEIQEAVAKLSRALQSV